MTGEKFPSSTIETSTKSPWGTELGAQPEASTFQGFVPERAELPPLAGEKKGVKSLARRAMSMFIKQPESSVGDVSLSVADYEKLSDYRRGLENLTDGGLEKTGLYDYNREEILSSLVDEARIEDEIRSHETPHTEIQDQVLDATNEDALKLSKEYAASGYKDQEMSRLIGSTNAHGNESDQYYVNKSLESYDYTSPDQIREQREKVLQAKLKKAEANTLLSTQTAALRGNRL